MIIRLLMGVLALGLPAPSLAQDAARWGTIEPTSRRALSEEGMPTRASDLPVKASNLEFPVGDTPGPTAIFGPEQFIGAPGEYPFIYALQYNFREKVANQNSTFGYLRNDFAGALPLYTPNKDLTVAATLNLRWLDFDTKAIFPTSQKAFPTALYNIEPGLYYHQKFENDMVGGAVVSLGSPSDKPYHSANELAPSVNAFLKVPRTNGDAYLFSFFYQPTGQLRYPLPAFAYQYNPTQDLQVNIGLPFDVKWRFADHWRLEAGYVPITSVRSFVYYDYSTHASIFAGFEWQNDSYLLSDRAVHSQYLFQYEKRVSAGFRLFATESFTADFIAGYAFDRFYFLGKNYSQRNHDRINIGDGPFVMLRAGLKF